MWWKNILIGALGGAVVTPILGPIISFLIALAWNNSAVNNMGSNNGAAVLGVLQE